MALALVEAQSMIDDAVDSAARADSACVAAIVACAVDPDSITTENARERQAVATRKAVEEIVGLLPYGQPESGVQRWWAGLTPEQQIMLKRAVPIELYDLPGIPSDVRNSLSENGRGYDPLATVRWARDNVNNADIDVFGNNCTNFVSRSLNEGGLKERRSGWGTTLERDNWGRSLAGDLGVPFVEGVTHTKSWYNADAQREFFLENGGVQIAVSDAQPGDVLYFNYAQPNESGDFSHHTALVTGILPDGQVLYAQHTPGAADYSLQDRLPMVEQSEGQQSVTIVRPKETW